MRYDYKDSHKTFNSKGMAVFVGAVVVAVGLCVGCSAGLCGKREREAVAEYSRIVPGEVFDKGLIKECKIVASAVIKEIKLSDAVMGDWTRLGLRKISGMALDTDTLDDQDTAKLALAIYKSEIYKDYVNLDDDLIEYGDLIRARVYFLLITEKPVAYKGLYMVGGHGPCYAFVVVSAKGYVLFKHDIERVRYITYSDDYLERIRRGGDYLPGAGLGEIICNRSYAECRMGKEALDFIRTVRPRTSNEIRKDLGYEELKKGWHQDLTRLRLRPTRREQSGS